MFVRLAICNLKCVWCDTPFTWNTTHPSFGYESLRPDTLAALIKHYGIQHVVFTGGEPLLQQSGLDDVITDLGYNYLVEVETAGTMLPTLLMERMVHQWNVSPKLSHSGNSEEKRDVPEVMRKFAGMPNAWFKFVITAPTDLEEVLALQAKYKLVSSHIILMPEGTESAQILERSRWVSELAEQKGFRFSPRLHVLLHGAERKR